MAIVMLVVLSPVLLLIAASIFALDGSPVFYMDTRIGKHGIPFCMFKFRTMTPIRANQLVDPQSTGRVTSLGALLRNTSLDELPQLLNIVLGEMSFVGPRPLPVDYLARTPEWAKKRYSVNPGVTGLAQIRGRNSLAWDEKFKHDVEYVETRSLQMNFAILLRTILTVISMKSVNKSTHKTGEILRDQDD